MNAPRSNFWLTHIQSHFWLQYEQYGVTQELYTEWSKSMRRPVYKWQELKWTPITQEMGDAGVDAERSRLLKDAEDAFCNFLATHPELPTSAIRPLIHEVLGWWYSTMRVNSLGRLECFVEDENRFMDLALRLFRDGEIEKVRTQQTETRSAVRDVEPWIEG